MGRQELVCCLSAAWWSLVAGCGTSDGKLKCPGGSVEHETETCVCPPGLVWLSDEELCRAVDSEQGGASAADGGGRAISPSAWDASLEDASGSGGWGVVDATTENNSEANDGGQVDPDAEAPDRAEPDAGPACSPTPEVCDGEDDDCDGEIDEEVTTRCWGDEDGDGFAAMGAEAVEGCDECGPKQTSQEPVGDKIDCDDASPTMSPGATDICGDMIDNDCDGTPDDEANNVCGGPCAAQLPGRPGEKCTNKLQGSCAREGEYECAPDDTMRCTAPAVMGTAEVCDRSDNDCDGSVDEGVTTRCWADPDGDGFAAAGSELPPSCGCQRLQTAQEPVAGKIDCAPSDSNIKPGASEVCGDDKDNDCDGDEGVPNGCGGCSDLAAEPGAPCSVGVGVCRIDTTYVCMSPDSVQCRATAPLPPTVAEVCGDGADNDCDGEADEGCGTPPNLSISPSAADHICSDGQPARLWYQDCDGDGEGNENKVVRSCPEPNPIKGCGWSTGWTARGSVGVPVVD